MKKTIFDTPMTENILQTFAVKAVNSDIGLAKLPEEEMRYVMDLYNKVAQVFIDNKVDIWTSLKVVSAMADAITVFLATRPLVEGENFSLDNLPGGRYEQQNKSLGGNNND